MSYRENAVQDETEKLRRRVRALERARRMATPIRCFCAFWNDIESEIKVLLTMLTFVLCFFVAVVYPVVHTSSVREKCDVACATQGQYCRNAYDTGCICVDGQHKIHLIHP